jgi:Flp pilus assembly protein protease CpaA
LLLFIVIGFITLDYENFDLLNHSIAFLIVLFLSVLFSIFCGLGVGDVKLLSLLAVFLLPPDVASYQIFVFSVAFSGFAYALCISKGDLRQKVKIPLAPAIFIGTTLAVFVK